MGFKFEDLKVWEEAVKFANKIYIVTKKFPKEEQYGLTSQMTRAAVSISLNIAEGEGRKSDKDWARFLLIALGSLNEVVTLLYVCRNQKLINEAEFKDLYTHCEYLAGMIHKFKQYLKC